jgi:superfamily II helicase
MSPSGLRPSTKDWAKKENGGVYGFDGKKQHKLFGPHKCHFQESIRECKDGLMILLKACECGKMQFLSAKEDQLCPHCHQKLALSEVVYLTKQYTYLICKSCLTTELEKRLKESFK